MKLVIPMTAIGLLACTAVAAQSQSPVGTTGTTQAATASADLKDTQGRSVGHAYLQQTPHGVLVRLELKNATPGVHGVHVHENGRCEAPAFDSAGDHFNPNGRQHGFLNPNGPHAGDLPNIAVPTSTELWVEHLMRDVTIDPGPRSLSDDNGSAIVIHSGKDDYSSDPAGAAGDRIACGAIVAAERR